MQKQTFAVFDTETVGLSPKLVYDVALVICDRSGKIHARKNWLVRDVLHDGKAMLSAFYARKIFSDYLPAIESGAMRSYSFADIRGEFNAMIAEHNAQCVTAYNIGFDRAAMRETAKHCNLSGSFLARPIRFADLWLATCEQILARKPFIKFAETHGLLTEKGNVKTSAEAAYSYITNNPAFVESHTALHDAEIETEILTAIFKRKQKFPFNRIHGSPWQIVKKAR